MVIRHLIGRIGTGIAATIVGIIVFAIATVTSLAVPLLIILALFHVWPFHGASHQNTSSSAIGFCSTLNEMTNYATSHQKPTTSQELLTTLSYSSNKLLSVANVPSDISGTVYATISTTRKLSALIQTAVADNGVTTYQRQQLVNLDGVFNHEVSTLNQWYQSNC